MLKVVIILLFLLWLGGYLHLPLDISNYNVLTLAGHNITLFNLVIFLLILYVIGSLPKPFREIVSVILILWVLSVFGIIAISGLNNILVIALIIGLIIYLFK